MAAYIVEKITGKRFEDYVAENFFQPIGMKSASYFQTSAPAATLYHDDGKTPFPYWNILLRPAGSINASANDMAAYVAFYLNRGGVNGMKVMPAASIDRLENPTRTWAAQEGLKAGYGLSNYWSVNDGFVYHGHDGGVNGGLTEMAYMPEYSVGYFYSINAGNGNAFDKIGKAIRAYITRDLTTPAVPPQGQLPGDAAAYAGWYEPDSPRVQMLYFFERLLGMVRVRFADGKMLLWPVVGMKDEVFLPVSGRQFRKVFEKDPPNPVATVMLLTPDVEGRFIQTSIGTRTLKRVPNGLAIAEIVLTVFVAVATVSLVLYAPFWMLGGISKKRRRPQERAMRWWPLIAVLSLAGAVALIAVSGPDIITRMGDLTVWSGSVFVLTLVFAVAAVLSVVAVWRGQEVRRWVKRYSAAMALALVIATAYLAYWGVIGLRTWG